MVRKVLHVFGNTLAGSAIFGTSGSFPVQQDSKKPKMGEAGSSSRGTPWCSKGGAGGHLTDPAKFGGRCQRGQERIMLISKHQSSSIPEDKKHGVQPPETSAKPSLKDLRALVGVEKHHLHPKVRGRDPTNCLGTETTGRMARHAEDGEITQ